MRGSGGGSKYSCCPMTSAAVASKRSGPRHMGQLREVAAKPAEKRRPQFAQHAWVTTTPAPCGGSRSQALGSPLWLPLGASRLSRLRAAALAAVAASMDEARTSSPGTGRSVGGGSVLRPRAARGPGRGSPALVSQPRRSGIRSGGPPLAQLGDLPVVHDVLAVDGVLQPLERRLEVLDAPYQIVGRVCALRGRRRLACGPQPAEGGCRALGDRFHGESPALSRLRARGERAT